MRVLDYLGNGSTVSATNDQNVLGLTRDGHGRMDQHLMVHECVFLRDHETAVENEDSSHRLGFKNFHALKIALLVEKLFVVTDRKGCPILEYFNEPFFFVHGHNTTAANAAPEIRTV